MGGDRYGGRDRGHLRPGDLRHPALPRARCVGYPYTSRRIAELFPEQYLWMYGAMLVMVLFVALVAAIHECAPAGRRI
jgi:hypothetical protein